MTIDGNPRERTAVEVQDEFFSHLTDMASYWIRVNNPNSYTGKHNSLKDRIVGFMHTFGGIVAGNAGGFDASVDMIVTGTSATKVSGGDNFFPPKAKDIENAVDINDGGLQYRAFFDRAPALDLDKSTPSREWTADEIASILYKEIASTATYTVDKNISGHFENDFEAMAFFVRSVLSLFEEGSTRFPATVELYAVSNQEDRSYFKEEGKNWMPYRTPLALPERSLTQAWDEWWDKTRPENIIR